MEEEEEEENETLVPLTSFGGREEKRGRKRKM